VALHLRFGRQESKQGCLTRRKGGGPRRTRRRQEFWRFARTIVQTPREAPCLPSPWPSVALRPSSVLEILAFLLAVARAPQSKPRASLNRPWASPAERGRIGVCEAGVRQLAPPEGRAIRRPPTLGRRFESDS
jgi:hypothetical protein